MSLPRISIITPSLNQASYLDETLRSVSSQEYPELEHIVIDGGSTDDSVAVIRRHENRLAYWVSEPDAGQAHAINKGFERATGEIVGWLNSDDFLKPGALRSVGAFFRDNPGADIACWPVDVVDEHGAFQERLMPRDLRDLPVWLAGTLPFPQMGTFWRRRCFTTLGRLNTELHYAFDFDFFARFIQRGIYPAILPSPVVAAFRMHAESKTVAQQEYFHREHEQITAQVLAGASRRDWRRYHHARNRILQLRRLRAIRDSSGSMSRRKTAVRLVVTLARQPAHTLTSRMVWKYAVRILRDMTQNAITR